MGMDNVFPGLVFNPDVHGCKEHVKPSYDISWNQEVIKVQHNFTLEEFHKLQLIVGKNPICGENSEKERIIRIYNDLLIKP